MPSAALASDIANADAGRKTGVGARGAAGRAVGGGRRATSEVIVEESQEDAEDSSSN